MNALTLTAEHKSKLLEMCNKLFSTEGKWFNILDGSIYYSKNGKFPGFSIHWFEFCVLHLLTAIKDLQTQDAFGFDGEKYDSFYKKALLKMFMYDNPSHPIDYLYKEFKKLPLCNHSNPSI